MIITKTDLSTFCKAVRLSITSNKHDIKLASVREAVAKSLSYKSVNDLLANLPVSLTHDFWDALKVSFNENHDIDFTTPAWSIPFPEHFPLNVAERNVIWQRLCQHFEVSDSETDFVDGSEMRPDGTGGWYFKYGVPYIAYDIEEFDAQEDPVIDLRGDELTVFEMRLQCINTETAESCSYTCKSIYHEVEHTSSSDVADKLGIATQKLPEAVLRIETEYPIQGFDSYIEENEIFFEDSASELVELLQTEGFPIIARIHGHEESLYELGYVQLFFLAEANESPADPSPFVFGNYLVSIVSKSKTGISSSVFNADKDTIGHDSDNENEILDITAYQRQRRFYHLLGDIQGDIAGAALSTEQMIDICIEQKEFPLFNFVEGEVDDIEEIELGINVEYNEDMFEITTMPLTNIIPMGHSSANGLIGAVSTLMTCMKDAGASVKINADIGEIYSANVNSETVLSVIYPHDYAEPRPVFGNYKGYLKPAKVSNWLKSIGVVQLSANAFNSGYTGDWIYLSMAGFDQTGQRICVLGITFYAENECDNWNAWFASFQKQFGSKVHINETYEHTWHFEENPRDGFGPPYDIPQAPVSCNPTFGLGFFAFWGVALNGRVPLVLPNRIKELMFTDRDLSKLPTFRITTIIAVPDGRHPFEFFNEAMNYAGNVTLDDDESWKNFMSKIFEFVVTHMKPTSQLYSFLIVEGGNNAIQNLCFNSLPTNLRDEAAKIWLGTDTDKPKFNTEYSVQDLKEISLIMNIRGVEGINFALSGELT